MKLKKIASLLLAGVMAMSMLAGCNTPDEAPSSSSEPTTSASTSCAELLKSKMSGSAKERVATVANAELDSALKNAVETFFDYNAGWVTDEGPDKDEHIVFDDLADYRADRVGAAVIKAMGANFNTITGLSSTDHTSKKTAVEVYAVPASTSDAYLMTLVAEKIDTIVTNLPKEGGIDYISDGKADFNYTYTVAASIETRTVTFAGVEQGVKYVAFMMTKVVTEKA